MRQQPITIGWHSVRNISEDLLAHEVVEKRQNTITNDGAMIKTEQQLEETIEGVDHSKFGRAGRDSGNECCGRR